MRIALLAALGLATLALPAFLDGEQLGIYILTGLAAMILSLIHI